MKIFMHYKAIIFLLVLILMMVYPFLSLKPGVPNFSEYAAGKERKMAFFNYFAPLIDENNQSIEKTRSQLLSWYANKDKIGWLDKQTLSDIALQYRVKDFAIEDDSAWQRLLKKVDVLPPSLVLAQAANESAWGTSRFARMANNYFGQWCFKQGCGLVPKKRGDGEAHEVAAFDTPNASLISYLQNLNSHPAYKQLREIRFTRRANDQPVTGYALAAGLVNYSERGEEYIEELRAMITFNQLSKYDQTTQMPL